MGRRRPSTHRGVSKNRGIMRKSLWLATALLLFPGCDDSTGPSPSTTNPAEFEGSFDPTTPSFVLQRVEIPVPGAAPLPVELVGSNLAVHEDQGLVALDVAIRNIGQQFLYPPAIAWVSDFVPPAVQVINSNFPQPGPILTRWGFDYSRLLGQDDMLVPGAESEPYRWRFHDPGLEAFSFSVLIEANLEPPVAVISGGVFEDLNGNGIRERNEPPWLVCVVHLTEPDGSMHIASLDEVGAFRFIVDEVGLYQLRLESLVDCPVCYTTPNPLEVLLTPAPDGRPVSFGQAVFGGYCGECGILD